MASTPSFDFLPLIGQIVEALQRADDDKDAMKLAASLYEKFVEAQRYLQSLPGAELTREDQNKSYAELQSKLERVNLLLAKYKSVASIAERPAAPNDAPMIKMETDSPMAT
eukprot:tig00000852_g5015.t1